MRHALIAGVALLCSSAAQAYEGGTTHAGLTAQAATSSELHRFLTRAVGQPRGLLETLKLEPGALDRRTFHHLQRKLLRLDPAGGYRPGKGHDQRALGWLMAGSVLADMPSSANRDHFYSPSLRRGLDNRRWLMSGLVGLAALFEGGDSVRQFLTGTGFDLTGSAAPQWATSADNPLSVAAFAAHLSAAITERSPARRAHRLALALVALGGVLHVLQDMASPTHVRDDFLGGHLQRLGQSVFYRGSSYERFVAETYGQFALPPPPERPITRARIRDYFTSERWDGLADLTASSTFSPGTLPPAVLVVRDTDPVELRGRLVARLPLSEPTLPRLDLACARRGPCHLRGPHGPLAAYVLDEQRQQLRLFLDRRCHRAAAQRLLSLAAGFSAGLINHLLRGRVELEREDARVRVTNAGAKIASGRILLLWEDAKGVRTTLQEHRIAAPAGKGAVLASLEPKVPEQARRLVALLEGKDAAGDPLVSAALLDLAAAAPSSSPATPTPAP